MGLIVTLYYPTNVYNTLIWISRFWVSIWSCYCSWFGK